MTSTEEAPSSFWDELTSPLNLVLVAVILYLVYKILRSHFESEDTTAAPPPPPMKKLRKDLTTAELKKYDGTGSDGRVLLAVNGVIFDVTRGKRFYGPGKRSPPFHSLHSTSTSLCDNVIVVTTAIKYAPSFFFLPWKFAFIIFEFTPHQYLVVCSYKIDKR